jgi:hypothetical protein
LEKLIFGFKGREARGPAQIGYLIQYFIRRDSYVLLGGHPNPEYS